VALKPPNERNGVRTVDKAVLAEDGCGHGFNSTDSRSNAERGLGGKRSTQKKSRYSDSLESISNSKGRIREKEEPNCRKRGSTEED